MKRVFALVLCLCMVLTVAPAAFAAETDNVSLNGNTYNTVEAALATAEDGTITLLANVTAGQLIIPKGVTLDLNGFVLTADMVIVFNGAIVDNGANTGKLVVAENMMKIIGDNSSNLPVWNPADACYTFATVSYQQMMNVAEDLSYANYIFVPNFDLNTMALLADGGADNGISVKVLLSWNAGASQQIYTFSDEMVAQVYASANASGVLGMVFQLTVTGFAGIEDMTACAVVESAAGNKVTNDASKVALPEPEDPYAEQAAIMEQIKALAAGASISDVTLTGEITEINDAYSTQYKNITVTIKVFGTEDTLKCYRIKGDAASILAVGDTITVNGTVQNYKHSSSGDTELEFVANSMITEHIPGEGGSTEPVDPPATDDPAADSTLTIAEAIALGNSKEHNVYTAGKYYVTGVIAEVKSPQYGNMYITDGNGNSLYVYGLYSADGSTRYDAMEVKPDAGDTVTVYGIIGQYSNEAQMKNAWLIAHTSGEAEPDEPSTGEGVTITFDDAAKRTVRTDNQQVWVESGITVTNNKTSTSSAVIDSASPVRFYKNSELIIEYAGGFDQIEFVCNTASYATALKDSITSGTVTVSGTKVTVTLAASAESFEVVLSGGQVRVDSITVS